MNRYLTLAAALVLASCGSADASEQSVAATSDDLWDSEADTSGERGSEDYQTYDDRRDAMEGSAGYVSGYGCTEDCSGHDAGYAWAEENDVTDEGDCGGNSWSFQEGCVAYVEDLQGESEAEAEY